MINSPQDAAKCVVGTRIEAAPDPDNPKSDLSLRAVRKWNGWKVTGAPGPVGNHTLLTFSKAWQVVEEEDEVREARPPMLPHFRRTVHAAKRYSVVSMIAILPAVPIVMLAMGSPFWYCLLCSAAAIPGAALARRKYISLCRDRQYLPCDPRVRPVYLCAHALFPEDCPNPDEHPELEKEIARVGWQAYRAEIDEGEGNREWHSPGSHARIDGWDKHPDFQSRGRDDGNSAEYYYDKHGSRGSHRRWPRG